MKLTNDECSTVQYLLSKDLEYEYQDKFLLRISQDTMNELFNELSDRFESLELTRADVKEAWKHWLDEAAHNGTMVSADFRIEAEPSYTHKELELIDFAVKLSTEAIDKLD